MLPVGGVTEAVERRKPDAELEAMIGKAELQQLRTRLESLNHDIATSGLHDFPEADGKMLTGYAYAPNLQLHRLSIAPSAVHYLRGTKCCFGIAVRSDACRDSIAELILTVR
jgi:hypothetical protein